MRSSQCPVGSAVGLSRRKERWKPSSVRHPSGVGMDAGAAFRCDHSCGFRGSYAEVEMHETRCASWPAAAGDQMPAQQKKAEPEPEPEPEPETEPETEPDAVDPCYMCEFDCGYEGTHADVYAHEQQSSRRVQSEEPASALAPDIEPEP